MNKTSIFQYYAFGYDYGALKDEALLGYEREDAIERLNTFLAKLDSLELPVTRIVANGLSRFVEDLAGKQVEKIDKETSKKLSVEMERIDPALDAEMQLRFAYVLTKKRYPLESLLDAPQSLLSEGVHSRLSDLSRRDFGLACTQIALSQPTAAAFHLMRCLEEQVRRLYCGFIKKNRISPLLWGPMTKALRAKRSPRPSDKLLDHLDGMRVHFRNPTQHPDLFYTLDEAQDLLNQTTVAINMVDSELPR